MVLHIYMYIYNIYIDVIKNSQIKNLVYYKSTFIMLNLSIIDLSIR